MVGNTTRQVVPELPLDKSRNRTLACLLTREERLQLFEDDRVENGLFRLAGNWMPMRMGVAPITNEKSRRVYPSG